MCTWFRTHRLLLKGISLVSLRILTYSHKHEASSPLRKSHGRTRLCFLPNTQASFWSWHNGPCRIVAFFRQRRLTLFGFLPRPFKTEPGVHFALTGPPYTISQNYRKWIVVPCGYQIVHFHGYSVFSDETCAQWVRSERKVAAPVWKTNIASDYDKIRYFSKSERQMKIMIQELYHIKAVFRIRKLSRRLSWPTRPIQIQVEMSKWVTGRFMHWYHKRLLKFKVNSKCRRLHNCGSQSISQFSERSTSSNCL